MIKPSAVVFDIDSTLADTMHRQDLILQGDERENTDWLAYARACGNDTPTAAVTLLKALAPYHHIVLLTSRPEGARAETEKWMIKHEVPFNELIMDDYGKLSTVAYKVENLRVLQARFDIKLLVEDSWNIRTKVEEELGIPTLVVRAYAPEALELRY